jgi:hypothetical protein
MGCEFFGDIGRQVRAGMRHRKNKRTVARVEIIEFRHLFFFSRKLEDRTEKSMATP